ncbi:MAG: BMP family ABC transporter substrate-binding protein [Chloroflexi bacterium]|nr:MAG: BMP family ABC transporter substrate-binding protein [Chloroflexota bacterium]
MEGCPGRRQRDRGAKAGRHRHQGHRGLQAEHPTARRSEVRRHLHRRLPHRHRHAGRREGQPGHPVLWCGPVRRRPGARQLSGTDYIKGYENGAKSVKSTVTVTINYVEDFNAPDKGEASAKTMIGQGVDVLFQVAGLTGAGVLRAACNAKVYGIGVDVDQYLSLPDSKACIITSAEKHLQNATRDAIKRFKDKGKQTGNFTNDATNDGIGASEIRNLSPVPAGLTDKLKQATEDMKSGKLKPIP